MPHYDPPDGSYTSRIPAGTAAFRKVVAQHFGYSRTEVVRDPDRCASQRSEHCECAAVDLFTTDVPKGRKLFDWCVGHADALGLQSCIFNRRVWGFGQWSERAYTGPNPHTDHVHVGLNRAARRTLTEQMVRDQLPGSPGPGPQPQEEQMKLIRFDDDPHGHVFAVMPGHLEHVTSGAVAAFAGNMDLSKVEIITASHPLRGELKALARTIYHD